MKFVLKIEADLSAFDLITVEKIEREIRLHGLNVSIDLPIAGKFAMTYLITAEAIE